VLPSSSQRRQPRRQAGEAKERRKEGGIQYDRKSTSTKSSARRPTWSRSICRRRLVLSFHVLAAGIPVLVPSPFHSDRRLDSLDLMETKNLSSAGRTLEVISTFHSDRNGSGRLSEKKAIRRESSKCPCVVKQCNFCTSGHRYY
jgi:hypothetical protein